jgi:RimJ/RimL family protein N-acetyltransferase
VVSDVIAAVAWIRLALEPASAALRQSGRVGSVGLHGPPDHARLEIGYEVVPAKRRSGFAREAVLGLTTWAHATNRARGCRVSITPDNLRSLALARSLDSTRRRANGRRRRTGARRPPFLLDHPA